MNLGKLDICRVELAPKRNGKRKKFYFLPNGEFYATTCCICGEVKHRTEMTYSSSKKYNVDSRCKKCDQERKFIKRYIELDFSDKIDKYLEKHLCDGVEIERGVPKNGYSRVIIKEYGEVSALSCSYCHEIKPSHNFLGSHTNKTGHRGECKECASLLKQKPRAFVRRKVK